MGLIVAVTLVTASLQSGSTEVSNVFFLNDQPPPAQFWQADVTRMGIAPDANKDGSYGPGPPTTPPDPSHLMVAECSTWKSF